MADGSTRPHRHLHRLLDRRHVPHPHGHRLRLTRDDDPAGLQVELSATGWRRRPTRTRCSPRRTARAGGCLIPRSSTKPRVAQAPDRRLFGGLLTHRKQWDAFNAAHGKRLAQEAVAVRAAGSTASSRRTRRSSTSACGGGRDSRLFARTGRPVIGCRLQPREPMLRAQRRARGGRRTSLRAAQLLRHPRRAGDRRPAQPGGPARRPLRAVRAPRLGGSRSRELLADGVDVAAQGRPPVPRVPHRAATAQRHHVFRQALPPLPRSRPVQAEIEANGGRVVHREAGTGLAPFRTEDPHVCRIVATWSE